MEKSLEEKQIEVLQTSEEYIVKLINGINMCIKNIEEDKKDEAMELLSYIGEGIEWLNEAARLTKNMHAGNIDEEEMKKKLDALRDYVYLEDYRKILELLKYEILNASVSWKEIINKSLNS